MQSLVVDDFTVTPENVLVEHPTGIGLIAKSNSMPLYQYKGPVAFNVNHNVFDA